MLSFLRYCLLAVIGFAIFFVLLIIALQTKNDKLMLIAFFWLFFMWPLIGLINSLF